jgi:putative peptidoglycan lipid II flippase
LYQPAPGWAAFGLRVAAGCAALAGALYWAARGIDWLGLQSQPLQRAALMAGVLGGVTALYFAVLRALGLDLRQFSRRGS